MRTLLSIVSLVVLASVMHAQEPARAPAAPQVAVPASAAAPAAPQTAAPARVPEPARQTPAPAPARPAAPAPRPVAPAQPAAPAVVSAIDLSDRQLVNIRIDVAVSEEGGSSPPTRRTVSLTLADRQGGSVRTTNPFTNVVSPLPGNVPDGPTRPGPRMNLDAFPMLQKDGRVQAQITLDYGIPGVGTSIKVEPLLESGKPLVASQSIDPLSDRRITVEITATVLK